MNIAELAPILPVSNMERSRRFYRDVLGADEGFMWEEAGKAGYVILRFPMSERLFHLRRSETAAHPVQLYLYCEDIETLHAHFHALRGVTVSGLTMQPWGMREFTLTDPDGHRWTFGQEVTP